jgi:gliding motility-associated-like protein
MKKISLLLIFVLSILAHEAFAQPTFSFTPKQVVVPSAGQEVCFSLTVVDFTDLLGIRFSINWDAGVMSFKEIKSLHPSVTGLDMSDFNTAQAAQGIVTFNWSNGQPCSTTNPNGKVTLPDNAVLFQICFTTTGIYGNHTYLEITDNPLERYVTRLYANCNDIGEFVAPAFVSIGTPPLTLSSSSVDGFKDDVVCVDFKVEDFKNIVSFQYAIKWDSTKLQYQGATPMNLIEFTNANIGTSSTSSGLLSLLWFRANGEPASLTNGSQILQVCFKILATCGTSASIDIVPTPNGGVIEVVNSTSGQGGLGTNIGILKKLGQVTVKCFNPNGITVNVDDKNVCPGESFTVDVKVQNFQSITKLKFNLQWNPSVIQLVDQKVSYPSGVGCFFFDNAVNSSQSNQGTISVDWSGFGFGCNLNNNYTLMRLHFKAIAPGGSNTTVSVVNPIFVEKNGNNQNIGINNNNGLISICNLTGLTMVASNAEGNPGDTVCVSFTVQDFDDITRMQYTINWEYNVLEFIGVKNITLQNMDQSNFFTQQAKTLGVLGVEWENAAGLSLPDGIAIFEVCFKVIGDPFSCSNISFSEIPYSIQVVTTGSNGTNVGLNGQESVVCALNPFTFITAVPDVYASPTAEICLDFTVTNFKQLTNMEYSINWNPNILQYVKTVPTGNLPSFTAASYNDDIALTSVGRMLVHWTATNQILGNSVPDDYSIFQVCFKVIGNPNQCSAVSITGQPEPIYISSATTGAANLGIMADQGSVCVSGVLKLDQAVITNVDCPTASNGAIDLIVAGGSGDYKFEWSGTGVNANSEDQLNLAMGTYNVTIIDAQNPGLTLSLEFEVGLTPNAPFANAGQDTTFNCNNFFLVLNGSGSSTGPDLVYLWEKIDNGLVLPGEANKMNPKVLGGSCYRLTVTDTITGCFDQDVVCIDAPVIPNTVAGEGDTITCLKDTVMLNGNQSTTFGFDIEWTAGPGGQVVAGTENNITPLVFAPGWYFLTISHPVTGCAQTDSVYVDENRLEPIASAGADTTMGCNDQSLTLDGGASSSGTDFTYEWNAMGSGQICGDANALQTTICAPGTYSLVVTDKNNGCTSSDMIEVTGDTLKPTANAGAPKLLTCTVKEVALDGTGSSANGNFAYQWTTTGGNIVSGATTLTPMVDKPGTYTLEVTDNNNGCKSISTVNVTQNIQQPVAVAAVDHAITCDQPQANLSGTGSSTGTGFSYSWKNSNDVVVGATLNLPVTTPGNYTLVVTNNANGCTQTASVMVEDKKTLPPVEAGDNTAITCTGNPTLNGVTDVTNPDLQIIWSGPVGNCIQNGSTPTPTVACPGVYTMTVFNSATGCFSKDSVTVVLDKTPPPVDAGPADTITCMEAQVVLQGTSAANVSASWISVPAGLPITPATSLTPTITQPGTYFLQVTSATNGCTATDNVIIAANKAKPTAKAGDDASVDCLNKEASISAQGSTLTNATITWKALSGSLPPGVENDVDIKVGAGTYELLVVRNDNGCEARDTVVVKNNQDLPTANAGADQTLGCADTAVQLNGGNSQQGTGITFTWTDANGKILGSGLTQQVSAPGTYTLTVFNSNNNCENSDQVVVNQIADGPPASAQIDADGCSVEAMLLGNLPDGASGTWKSTTGALISQPNAATTLATGLKEGLNVFIWTLSLGSCINYSSDTVSLDVEQGAPKAVNDLATLAPGTGGVITLNVMNNDAFTSGNVTFKVLTMPSIGTLISSPEGELVFTKEKCFTGVAEITYEICSVACPNLCDTATVRITVEQDPAENCDEVPNGITPNGDGANDELVFDIILNNPPDEFPDNEIIIFNRWGDVVYQARPYQNDWRGTNNKGQDLPHGTYYYILKLNIADGKIIKGDVTILK